MKRAAASGLLVLLALASAHAHAPTAQLPKDAPAFVRQPVCTSDVKRFCASVSLGHGRIRGCLDAHRTQLTPFCSQKLEWIERMDAQKATQAKIAVRPAVALKPLQPKIIAVAQKTAPHKHASRKLRRTFVHHKATKHTKQAP